MAGVTRSKLSQQSPLFDNICDLKGSQLPTYQDIIKCFLWQQWQLKQESKDNAPKSKISELIGMKVIKIYNSASIPTISVQQINAKIVEYYEKYRKLLKPYKSRKSVPSYLAKLNSFVDHSNSLFEFCACKCVDFDNCSCPKDKKIPVLERNFILDQRNERKMFIGNIDKIETSKMIKKAQRKTSIAERKVFLSQSTSRHDDPMSEEEDGSSSSELSLKLSKDEDYVPSISSVTRINSSKKTCDKSISKSSKSFKKLKLSSFAEACDRVGVSNRGAALLSSSLMEDITFHNTDSASVIIDKNKIQRERSNTRIAKQREEDGSSITSLYFDGKKDITCTIMKKGDKSYNQKVSEEHISLIAEPGKYKYFNVNIMNVINLLSPLQNIHILIFSDGKYLGHLVPTSGSARNIANDTIDYLTKKNVSLASLVAIGCDGTAVNTGVKGGIIRLIEETINRPLHWFVCLLHSNELPLRHLIDELDGRTSGPRGFVGPIGKQLLKCETKDVVSFKSIPSESISIENSDLSTDQKYLLDIYNAVREGEVTDQLAIRSPGKMHHARWITTANRILRLYVSTTTPTENLMLIVSFIMKVYAPMWFNIKRYWQVKHGPQHIFNMINLFKQQDLRVQKIVFPVLQRNAFFAHPENILLSMISDSRPHIRKLGWCRIKKARTTNSNSVRRFSVPPLNKQCEDYIDILNWRDLHEYTEPPITKNLTDEQINSYIDNPLVFEVDPYPIHTQAVERTIKLVSEACLHVASEQAREGYILNKLASQKRIKLFDSKKDFVLVK